MLDPRFTTIIAAAGAAAASLSPNKGVGLATTLTTLLQAASDFQSNIAAGTVTEEELAAMLGKIDENLAGLGADIAAARTGQAPA